MTLREALAALARRCPRSPQGDAAAGTEGDLQAFLVAAVDQAFEECCPESLLRVETLEVEYLEAISCLSGMAPPGPYFALRMSFPGSQGFMQDRMHWHHLAESLRRSTGAFLNWSELKGGRELHVLLPIKPLEPCVLVVDDDSNSRKLARVFLEGRGHEVVEASSGGEALRIFDPARCGTLLTDLRMPGMDGKDLSLALMRRRPGLKVIYMSSYSEQEARLLYDLGPGAIFLSKPFSGETLLEKIARRPSLLPHS